jgi:outer membrane protein assembly factor BamA
MCGRSQGLKKVVVFIVLLLSCFAAEAQIISEVQFLDLRRTKYSYLRDHIVKSKVGDSLNLEQVSADMQEIYNLRHFSGVNYKLQYLDADSSRVILQYIVKETISVIPNLEVGATRDFFKLKIGYTDFNAWGRTGLTNLYIQQFGRITYFFSGDYPFILGGKSGLQFDLYRAGTIEPIYYSGIRNEYNYTLDNVMLLYRYDIGLRSFLKAGIGYQLEDFVPKNVYNLPAEYPLQAEANRATARVHYRYSKVNLERMTQKGIYLDATFNGLISNVAQENPLQGNSFKFLVDARTYRVAYKGGNTAARVRLGFGQSALFDQFTLDDNTNIRGIGFKRVRRNYEFVINLEHRQNVIEHRLGIVQAVVFNDFTIGRNNFGGGLHFYLEPIHGVVFRVDYGMNIMNIHDAGIVAGIHQYF